MLEGDDRESGGREGCVRVDAIGSSQGSQVGRQVDKNNRVAEAEIA